MKTVVFCPGCLSITWETSQSLLMPGLSYSIPLFYCFESLSSHLILKPLEVAQRWLLEPGMTKAKFDMEGAWLSNCFSKVGKILLQVETVMATVKEQKQC